MSVQLLDTRASDGLPQHSDGSLRCYSRRRNVEDVTQVCLHHWGTSVSVTPRAGETREDAAIRRARSTVYHVSVFRDLVVAAWPLDLVTWHSNAFNRTSAGLALCGRFPAYETHRGPEHDDPLDFLDALEVALNFLDTHLPNLRDIVTHSQSAAKPSDPGELTARLAVQIGETLPRPLRPRPDLKFGKGSPWPQRWRRPVLLDRWRT